ncbi:type II toxin-antitoxin system VapC family toxin [Aquisphaera insulae]|uniref:type II toxin-antitoxin system VapC family toxin n=1 Tax=Aquisphaera insulae TaxID=2712864 RepID=UPI0021105FE8|nr:PIN domain-containing protein [Aquisphaera insulae]
MRVWPLTDDLPGIYAALFHELRAKGRILSQVDLILASLALSLNATLLTSDRDFEAVSGLRIENWIA